MHMRRAGHVVERRLNCGVSCLEILTLEHPVQLYADIEDLLIPGKGLDVWERALYYHLLRHTRLEGRRSATFAIAPLSKAVGMSDFKVREVIRTLHHKGCIEINDRSRIGHLVTVNLPLEIEGISRPDPSEVVIDLESIDFFNGRAYVEALLARENGRCFYCLKKLTLESAELDHLVPQVIRKDNSYRNIVASCHGCNKAKGDTEAADYIRQLFREGVLNDAEFKEGLSAIEAVANGDRAPTTVLRTATIEDGQRSS